MTDPVPPPGADDDDSAPGGRHRLGQHRAPDGTLSWPDTDGTRLHVGFAVHWDDEYHCHLRRVTVDGHSISTDDARLASQAIRDIAHALDAAHHVEQERKRLHENREF